jgi:threonine/homoserine/homoserine lactone efflux protein
MEIGTAVLFAATILPLICTPGPDMLLVASQALSGGAAAGLRATAGVCLGYGVHSTLVAAGVAAAVAASPMLFEALRWLGAIYLVYLACRLIRSALRAGAVDVTQHSGRHRLKHGFLTALLNPKGMMIYFAILPQFVDPARPIGLQAFWLSAIFIALCGGFYSALSVVVAAAGKGAFSGRRRRWTEGTAGGLLFVAAARLAVDR